MRTAFGLRPLMIASAIPLSWVRRQAAGAVAGGLGLDRIFERALISPSFDDDRDVLSPAHLTLLYATLVRETEDEAHALSRRPIPMGCGTLAFRLMWGSETLGAALQAVARLYELSASTMKLALTVEDEVAVLQIRYEDGHSPNAFLLEDCYLTYLFMGISRFLGRPLPALWVALRDPMHMNLGGWHWSIKAPVCFAGAAGLAFPRALLGAAQAIPNGEATRWAAFQDWLDFVEGPAATSASAWAANRHALRVDAMAAGSGVSASTLRRRMAREGGFRSMRRRTLAEAGARLLAESAVSVEAVAAELGYADARSFRRFIKSATGRTPEQLRAAIPTPSSPAIHARLKDVIDNLPD